MTAPGVSVLMPAYNRETTIASAIESVLANWYQDFELVVVDNASGDGTVRVAREIAERDPRVRVHVNERNIGQFGNRNRAAELARGRFLKFHDSDDLMYPHCLAVLVPLLEAAPEAAFALSSGASWPGGPCPMLLTPRLSYEREFLGRGMFYCGPAGALFRAEAFRATGGFEDRGAASDLLFWIRVCRTQNVLLVPGDLFWYRIHPNQEFGSDASAGSYADVQGLTWRALGGSDCPLAGEALEQARRNWMWTMAKLSYRDLKAGRLGLVRRRWNAAAPRLSDVAHYLRRQRRIAHAGTPLTPSGDFELSSWPVRRP